MQRSAFVRAATITALAALSTLTLQGVGHAQPAYPSKTVKLIVPYPPGASTDNMARAFAQQLAKELKGTVIVENRPGGGTSVGALAVKAQPADGHTLLFQTGELLATKLSSPNLAYEIADFDIIAPLAKTPFALVVPANIKSLAELKARAAAKNGELDFGTLGLGANQYTLLSRKTAAHLGAKARMIPYKGGMEGITAAMTGEVDAYFATVGLTHSQKDNAKLNVLAISSTDADNKFLPGVKSFKTLGMGDVVYNSYYGIAVRSNTPAPLKEYLKQVTRMVSDSKELKAIRNQISLEDFPGSLDDYKAETLRTFGLMKTEYEQENQR